MSTTIKVGVGLFVAAVAALAACGDSTSSGATSFDAGAPGAYDAASSPSNDGAAPIDAAPEAAAPEAEAAAPKVFFSDFEGAIPAEIAPGTGVLTPTQGYATLGSAGNTFGAMFLRSPTGNTVTMTVTGLAPHTKVSLAFLFAAIDSLDGTGTFPAGDFLRITLDGKQIFRQSFANATPDQIQDYVPPAGGELARHLDLGFQGPGGYYTDSAYDMGVDPLFHDIPHTASTAVLEFTIEGEGVQTLDDESWALDNVRLTTSK
jgi:hypothetical protein